MARKKAAKNTSAGPCVPAKLAQAIGHPLRVRILEALATRAASAKSLSEDFEAPLGVCSYHLRQVLDRECGLVEVVGSQQRRGAIETFYRLDQRAFEELIDWEALPRPAGDALKKSAFDGFVNLLAAAVRNGAASDTKIFWKPLVLDKAGWSAVHGALSRADDEINAAIRDSRRRLKAGADAVQAVVGIAAFEAVPSPSAPKKTEESTAA